MGYGEHLKTLLEKAAIPEQRRNALVAGLHITDPGRRSAALEALEKSLPGIAERLEEIWVDQRSRAVQFFRVPVLDGSTQASMKRLVTKRYNAHAASGHWHSLKKPRGHVPHLRVIRLGKKELDLNARLYIEHSAQLDDEVNEYMTHQDVYMRVEFSRTGGAVAEVFATTVYARAGLRLGLESLLHVEIPKKRNRMQEKYMLPLRFNEAHVKAVAKELHLEVTELDGMDPEDALGGFAVYGKEDGEVRKPLPADDPRVKTREGAGNAVREYRYKFDHGDGYTEQAEVRFALAAQHPHVTFTRVSSRPAKRQILDALLEKVSS